MNEIDYQTRLLQAIPGGAHTYSRGFDQFPSNAPQILKSGKGVFTYDLDGREFIDYGMALRAVGIGYSEDSIDSAAINQIQRGNGLTRPSEIELEAAELLIDTIDSVEMVKFTKNGSTAVTAAVKLARAFTGRTLVARCAQQPFFSFDDWFIASTPIVKGIPPEHLTQVKNFNYNDIESLNSLIREFPNEIACVILEPASIECPGQANAENICTGTIDCLNISNCRKQNFLQKVQEVCNKNDIVFILDEMITGFRWDLKGAQNYFNVKPDLSTFGKAMANGFSVSCVAGKREIMQQGSIEFENEERLFLLSTTHGAEMSGLGAFVETVNFIKQNDSISHLWKYGKSLINGMNGIARDIGIEKYFKVGGFSCSPYYQTFNLEEQPSLEFRTLFSQEMIENGVLMPWMALAYRHDEIILERTLTAVSAALMKYSDALEFGLDKFLVGPSIKPVFRKFN